MVDDPNKTESGSFLDDEDFLAADAPVTETIAEKRNLKEIWDQTPSLKIFAVVAGIAFIVILYMVFSGGDDAQNDSSNVRPTADISQPPGTAELPPAYEEAVRQANTQSAEMAAQTGGSAIPTPIARPSERIEAPVQVEEADPLSEWRREAESRRMERQQEEDSAAAAAVAPPPALPSFESSQTNTGNFTQQQPQNAPPPLPTAPTPDQISAITQQLQQFMGQNVIEPQTPKESVVVRLNIEPGYDMKKYFPDTGKAQNTPAASNGSGQNNSAAAAPKPKPIIDAGTIAYGQILTQANSDVPGPVLAEVASGPLVGGRAIGQFSTARQHMVVQFNKVVKDGVEYPVQAFALDPATTLPGVVTDVDNHYFRRVFLPAAASFIEGFAEAATRTDTDVVVTNGTVITNNTNDLDTRQELLQGVNEGARELTNIIDQQADRPITIKIAAGTRIGLLFLSSVFDPNAQQNQLGQNPYGQNQYGQNQYGQNPYGQQQGFGQNFLNTAGQAYNAYNAYNNSGYNNGYNQNQGYNSYGQAGAAGSFAAGQQAQPTTQTNTLQGRNFR